MIIGLQHYFKTDVRSASITPMSAIRINGIRVGHQMFHLRQYPDLKESGSTPLLFAPLARDKINLPCLGLEALGFGHAISCCLEGDVPQGYPEQPVCMISVYPHGSKSATLGYLLALFGKQNIHFLHMVSSNAMISFVIEQKDKNQVLTMLETTFDLPPTHTPYEPSFHEETAEFVKKRYQETKAYFREKKIKTYGFSLESDLTLLGLSCFFEDLEAAGNQIHDMDAKFYFSSVVVHEVSALVHDASAPVHEVSAPVHEKKCHLYCLTKLDEGDISDRFAGMDPILSTVDLVTFHGPHFGDRFGIFNSASACLELAGLTLVLAGCTGASVSLVLPSGQGAKALPALEKGFETP